MPIKDKYIIKKDILTHQGTLHKDDVVTLEEDHSSDKHTTPSGTYEYKFLDWDSSSGVSCGNAWGKCTNVAEIYMNILSPDADNSIKM